MKTLKILGFLLAYPTSQHLEVLDECREILNKEKWLSSNSLTSVNKLMDWMSSQDLLDLQEAYVDLFDRTPSLSLHFFEHVHGDSRDRGQAMVNLIELYKSVGLVISTDEMPDYLPLFLEYLSIIPLEDIQDHLGSAVNIIAALEGRLKNRKSPYASIFSALVDTASNKPDPIAVEEALKKSSGAAYDLETLDKEWAEQFAFENTEQTTGQSDGCPRARDMLARMQDTINNEGAIQ